MKYNIEFYQKENGRVPVSEYLMTLSEKIRAKAILEIELLEKHGTDLKEPYVIKKTMNGDDFNGKSKR